MGSTVLNTSQLKISKVCIPIDTNINRLNSKKWITYGDSITAQNYYPLAVVTIIVLTPYDYAKASEEVAGFMNVPYIDKWSCGINCFNRVLYIATTNQTGGLVVAKTVVK